jgi:hypothetical protein
MNSSPFQKDGFIQYFFELADGIQRSYPKLTARGAERQAKQVIDDMTEALSSEWNIPAAENIIIIKVPNGDPLFFS